MKRPLIAGVVTVVALLIPAASLLAQPRPAPPEPHHMMVPPPPPGRPGAPMPPMGVVRPPSPQDYRVHLIQVQDRWRAQRVEQRRDIKVWHAQQAARAAEHRHELAATWGNLPLHPEARAELALHAERIARLNRILDIAEDTHNGALAAHCRNVIERETERDARIMHDYRTRWGVQ